ncbi:hypothetical protein C8J57DRAFT_318099 [Mycena rebaudengoi]|nr:hypothetical protein C8J57DRAFT_318099 [Mycena rebaudengoi]
MSSYSERPTLPPLHTLDLPTPYLHRRQGSPYDSPERPSCPRLNVPRHSWSHNRRVSTSSSTSRTPSPTPSDASTSSSTMSHCSPSSPSKMRLVPSSFADANAILVIPPPETPYIPDITSACRSPLESARAGQGLLLFGSAMEHLRHPQRQLAKGARLHPYRIMRVGEGSRRTSVSSSMSCV